ncbi:MAG: hypothetical protein IPO21_14810 [Bacteroidales bacterium]|nr:hypothetical protein [Bacteroidales bacterium]
MTNRSIIFVSKKLESVVPSTLIQLESDLNDNYFGKWNATMFYVSKKKCVLLTNSSARYTVIIPGLVKNDFKNITEILIEKLTKQFEKDEILITQMALVKIIGKVSILKTDNDKKIIGTQNYILGYIDDWKYEFGEFANWDFYEIGRRINEIPYEQIGWMTPREKMNKIINEINASAS